MQNIRISQFLQDILSPTTELSLKLIPSFLHLECSFTLEHKKCVTSIPPSSVPGLNLESCLDALAKKILFFVSFHSSQYSRSTLGNWEAAILQLFSLLCCTMEVAYISQHFVILLIKSIRFIPKWLHHWNKQCPEKQTSNFSVHEEFGLVFLFPLLRILRQFWLMHTLFKILSFLADERKKKGWLLCWRKMTHAIEKDVQHSAGYNSSSC